MLDGNAISGGLAMYDVEEAEHEAPALERLLHLEARVAELERTLMRVLGAQALAPSNSHFAKTQKLVPIQAADAVDPPRKAPDALGITDAFATLDSRVAEEADRECEILRKRDTGPIVPIEASLIDDAFRPPARVASGPTRLEVRAALEGMHPRLIRNLTGTWRTPEGCAYLKKLIIDDRGSREGFPAEVMSELLLLSEILDTPDGERD